MDCSLLTESDSKPEYAALPGQGLTKEEAFRRVLEGHWRYLDNNRLNRVVTSDDRQRHVEGQYPFASILGCADSRVSPEVIFDQGQGDLFVVRVAGQVVGEFEIASLEYSVEHLGVSLIIVMGHENCGAVKAAIEAGEVDGAIGSLIKEIKPAVELAESMEGDLLPNAVRSQVVLAVDNLVDRSPLLQEAVDAGRLRIIGLIYGLSDGDLDIRKTIG
mgnify:CR=1 FL=1